MTANLLLIAHEVKQLARDVTSMDEIAKFINKCHGTKYHGSDIEKILRGLKPTDSIPRPIRSPAQVRDSKLMHQPMTWHPPISVPRPDPLAAATNRYIEKYRDKIEALAR